MAYNKNELVHKIQSLSGLSNEEKSALLELLRTNKKYGLVWENKPEEVEERLRSELPVLKEDKTRAIISDAPDAPNHLLIEGDNLEALVALTYTHAGRIDVIYIDPPYNTGKRDFIYNDAYVAKEDSFRHSKWVSFMSKRLRIAKTLLSEKGVIFISIDDNEYSTLKLLCDEIFTEKSFIASFVWKSKSGGANDARYVATDSENILMYINNDGSFEFGRDSELSVSTSYNREDENGRYSLDRLDKQNLGYHESLDFPIIGPDGREYTVFHRDPEHKAARWRWGKDTVRERYDELVFENGCVYTKNYESGDAMPRNLLIEERFGRTRTGKTELFSIIGANDFDNPKPSRLIGHLLKLYGNKDCIVLDFFAGSGTTLNAVLSVNNQDEGHRTCILCTNNESNICSSITYPRAKNLITGYTTKGKNTELLYSEEFTVAKLRHASQYLEKVKRVKTENRNNYESFKVIFEDGVLSVYGVHDKSVSVAGLKRNSLRYYQTDFVGRERTVKGMRELMNASTELLCIKNDLYTEVQELSGNKLNTKIARYFDDGKKRMLVVYQEEAIPAIAELIASMDYPGKMLVYVFSPGNYPYEDEFVEIINKVELCALPAAIYNAYRKVLPKKKVVKLPEAEDENAADAFAEQENPSVDGQF